MCKVLVVDDDKDLLEVIVALLSMKGFEVKTNVNWENGFDVIKEFQPQLILLDVFLSGVDGLEICKQLKSSSETKHIPIIIFSGYPRVPRALADSSISSVMVTACVISSSVATLMIMLLSTLEKKLI